MSRLKGQLLLVFGVIASIVTNAQNTTKEDIKQLGEIVHNTLNEFNSVYIEDSIVYMQLLSGLESSNYAVNSFCYSELLKYGDVDLLKRYAVHFNIIYEQYPQLYALISDTVKANNSFPLWLNATLGDNEVISKLINDFENENDFAEKKWILDCLLRVKDKRVLDVLLKEYNKNCYYHYKGDYAYFNSKYFLLYWLRYICNKDMIFRDDYVKYVSHYYIHYYPNDLSNGPNILRRDNDIAKFIDTETMKNDRHIEYLKRVEDYVEKNFNVLIDSKQIDILFFYYFVEIEYDD